MRDLTLRGRVINFSTEDSSKLSFQFEQTLDTIVREVNDLSFSEDQIYGVRLCLIELLVNAFKHGNKKNSRKSIALEYKITGGLCFPFGSLRVFYFFGSITDEGDGFAFDKLPDPTLEENLEKVNGRGIHMVKAYSDELKFEHNGNGFRVSFVIYK